MPALPRISWCADKGFLYFDIERKNILYLFYIATGSLHRIWDSLVQNQATAFCYLSHRESRDFFIHRKFAKNDYDYFPNRFITSRCVNDLPVLISLYVLFSEAIPNPNHPMSICASMPYSSFNFL